MTEELQPVRCGCGGEATVDCYLGGLDKNDLYYVYCPECNIQTANYLIEAEAVQAWNRAMGARTAKVESYTITINPPNNIWKCGNCGQQMCETHFGNRIKYCSHCGARLEWNE